MRVGTKSVLFGAHQFLIHPWFVAAAWWMLYGFPLDPRLWVAFFVHDLGYIRSPNMDGPEGECHVEFGARIMHWLFDWIPYRTEVRYGVYARNTTWMDFARYHSRFYAKRDGVRPSKLCAADKLAVALEPWWLYLPRVILTGEINEYMEKAGGMPGSKYTGEPKLHKYSSMNLLDNSTGLSPWHRRRIWFDRMTNYLRRWADEHKDGREDTWTPATAERTAKDTSGVWN